MIKLLIDGSKIVQNTRWIRNFQETPLCLPKSFRHFLVKTAHPTGCFFHFFFIQYLIFTKRNQSELLYFCEEVFTYRWSKKHIKNNRWGWRRGLYDFVFNKSFSAVFYFTFFSAPPYPYEIRKIRTTLW